MSGAPEEFEQLQKLLKIKQYEQPPPGYFKNFSSNLTARLEHVAAPEEEGLWVRKLLDLLQTNPLVAGAFGAAMCGLLILAIVFSYVDVGGAADGRPTENLAEDFSAPGQTTAIMAMTQGESVTNSSSKPVFSTDLPGMPTMPAAGLGMQPASFNPTPK